MDKGSRLNRHPANFARGLIGLLALAAFNARAATSDGPPTADPGQLYQRGCAACHDHPTARIPARALIARHSPDEVMQILTAGRCAPRLRV
jgi:hypothetical protein